MTLLARPAGLLRLAAAGALALALSGCVSLLPKSKPVQLYRFAASPPAAAQATAPAPAEAPIGVFRANGFFQREAAGDQILTLTGGQAAYIAGARWVAPAEVLFDEAVVSAFEMTPGRVRLVSRGEQMRSAYALRLDVRNFETRYEGGQPVVLVRVRAALTRDVGRTAVGEQIFEARLPASDNRVSAIVAAYDQAVSQVLGQVVAWTNAQAT